MFTGLISDIGTIIAVHDRAVGRRFEVACHYASDGIALGASVCHAGVCLTVVEAGAHKGNPELGQTVIALDVSPETLERSTAGTWAVGTRLNLERSLTLGDELGGHLVTGHIDGVARVTERTEDGDMARFTFEAPAHLSRFIAEKGSVALDGTSLTVNSVDGNRFSVMLIPHSLAVTTWGTTATGDAINIEVDLMARYAARLMDFEPGEQG